MTSSLWATVAGTAAHAAVASPPLLPAGPPSPTSSTRRPPTSPAPCSLLSLPVSPPETLTLASLCRHGRRRAPSHRRRLKQSRSKPTAPSSLPHPAASPRRGNRPEDAVVAVTVQLVPAPASRRSSTDTSPSVLPSLRRPCHRAPGEPLVRPDLSSLFLSRCAVPSPCSSARRRGRGRRLAAGDHMVIFHRPLCSPLGPLAHSTVPLVQFPSDALNR